LLKFHKSVEVTMSAITIDQVEATLRELVGLPSQSHHEKLVREYLEERLNRWGFAPTLDPAGNLMALIPGSAGKEDSLPLLYNAHLDRVPPGHACHPIVRDGRMHGDGKTNLGADDAAGIAIIVLAVEALVTRQVAHGPLLLLFTVAEEIGLLGARAFDPAPWKIRDGIVFDNAGDPGAVVTRGAAYLAFDATMHGKSGHPGKDLAGTASAIEMFRALDLPGGVYDQGATRLSYGTITGGTARNAVADTLTVQGELRTLADAEGQTQWLSRIQTSFEEAARSLNGTAEVTFDAHGASYSIDEHEPLIQLYRSAWEARGHTFQTMPTFVGSDANAFRQHLRVFTVSTGVADEHTLNENIELAPLVELAEAAFTIARDYVG
jgi:tripeptide aminopeptidase